MENKQGKIEQEQERTRWLSIKEGSACSIMVGAGEANIIPYALELNATNLQTGLLTSFANFFGPLAQILGSRLIEKFSRRKIIVWGVMFQVASCFVFALLGLVFLQGDKTAFLIPILILTYISYHLTGSLGGPAWFSLLGDVVPEKIRGQYFSIRNKITGAFSVSATLLAAFILFYFQKGEIIYGFIIIFLISGLARAISAFWLNQHYEPELKLEKGYYFSFWSFVKNMPKYNFNKFTLYVSLFRMTTNIAGPFFAVYVWSYLGYNPIWYTGIIISAGIFAFMLSPVWGKFSDKYGNRELIRVSSLILALSPFLWLLSDNPVYLVIIPQLAAGAGWSGFNLASSNFIYDSFPQQRRAMIVSYYNLLNGVGIFFGALAGGLITQYLILKSLNVFFLDFIISGSIGLLIILLLLPLVKEVRTEFHPASKNPLYYFKEIKPIYGTFRYSFPVKRFQNIQKRLKRPNRITYY